MARISDGTFKQWADGDTVTAAEYMQELEIIRAAVNSTDDDVTILKSASSGTIKRVPSGTAFPSTPEVGDIFYRTDQDLLYVLGSDSQWQVQSVKTHAARTDNPHSVTASQVGAYSTAESDTTFAKKTQSAWSTLATINGWASVDLTKYEMKLFKDEFGIVHFNGGRIKNGTTTGGTAIATIPAGYRPLKNVIWKEGSITFELDGSTGNLIGWGLDAVDTIVGTRTWRAEQ